MGSVVRYLVAAGLVVLLAGCATPGHAGPTAPPTEVAPSQTVTATPSDDASPSADAASSAVSAATTPPKAAADCSVVNCVAITYDDGPSPLTSQLLDIYIERGAVATFFVHGPKVVNDPVTVQRAHDAGMEIGNHSSNHPNLSLQSAEVVAREIGDTQLQVAAVTGQAPKLLRPPYGETSATVNQIAGQQGLSVVNWTDGPADWENHDAVTVAALTLARVRPGAIILMHDTHQWTVDAAPAIIDGLRQQGYELVTVSQIIGSPQPGQFYTDGQAPA